MKKDSKVPVYTAETDPDLIQVRRNMEFQERVDAADTPEKFAALQRELSGGTLEVTPEVPAKTPRKSSSAAASRSSATKMIAVRSDIHERFVMAKLTYAAQNGRSVGASTFLSKLLDAALPVLVEDAEESMRLMKKLRRARR